MRGILGALLTMAGYVVDPTVGLAIGVVSGLWVVLGIGSVISHASNRPNEHRVQIVGTVAHVVPPIDRSEALGQLNPGAGGPRRAGFVECPDCSSFIGTAAARCACGWVVPSAARPKSLAPIQVVMQHSPSPSPAAVSAGDGSAAAAPRACPACPRCRAPTSWVAEFERFMCTRCDLYV